MFQSNRGLKPLFGFFNFVAVEFRLIAAPADDNVFSLGLRGS